jgi:hypothetical protein
MSAVHERLRSAPNTQIVLVEGPDDLCACFPQDQVYHCENVTVHNRDALILERLGLRSGETWAWGEIQERIAVRVVPEDVPRWCSSCPWLPYGVCEKGVARVRNGEGLAPLTNVSFDKND